MLRLSGTTALDPTDVISAFHKVNKLSRRLFNVLECSGQDCTSQRRYLKIRGIFHENGKFPPLSLATTSSLPSAVVHGGLLPFCTGEMTFAGVIGQVLWDHWG